MLSRTFAKTAMVVVLVLLLLILIGYELGPAVKRVRIAKLAFAPKVIRIRPGTRVIWTNEDASLHTVTSDAGEFDSEILHKGDTFALTFKKKGTFRYHCRPHPSMKGTVIVR